MYPHGRQRQGLHLGLVKTATVVPLGLRVVDDTPCMVDEFKEPSSTKAAYTRLPSLLDVILLRHNSNSISYVILVRKVQRKRNIRVYASSVGLILFDKVGKLINSMRW